MISERHKQLIHEVLEGDATPAQRTELEQLVAADPEIRARHEELSAVFRLLGEAHDPEVPQELHADIMRAVAAEPPHGIRARRPAWNLLPLFGAFSAGAVVAALIIVPALRGPTSKLLGDHALLTSGTMAPVERDRGTVVSMQSMTTPGGSIAAVAWRSGNRIQLELDVQGDHPAEIAVDYAPEALGITAMRWPHEVIEPATVSAGHLMIRVTRPGPFVLEFVAKAQADSPIHIRAAGGEEATLHTAKQPGG